MTERSICREIREISRDGRGNPIPIVTRIYYNPEQTGIAVTELYLATVDSAPVEAERNASGHHARLNQTETIETRGPNFLCAEAPDTDEISCQIVSPYPGNIPLVVYCDTRQCEMPVMAFNEQLIVGATWRRAESTRNNSEQTGAYIVKMAKKIHDLLATLS